MDLKDMILVTENDRGTETNMLMTLDDYKSFIAIDDMSELADNLLQLGRTLGKVLNAGIDHMEETAGIGESGNCVLCGHNGSRYGTFFTPLNQISIGDEVMITDKKGLKHIYEVTETEVVNPYDNSIKTQSDEKELTLFTCSQKGTMRFVVRCIYKEAVMDE